MKAFLDDIIQSFQPDPRVAAFRKLSKEYGLNYSGRQRWSRQHPDLEAFSLFGGKQGKRISAMLSLESDEAQGRFRIYDYNYFGHIGKKTTTVIEYYRARLGLTPFKIYPRGKFSSIKSIFMSEERLFATTPDFDERYYIETKSPEEIKYQLNEGFLDLLGDEPGWTVEGAGDYVIFYQHQQTLPVSDLIDSYSWVEQMCERLINGKSSAEFV